jgi:hypothetical protein
MPDRPAALPFQQISPHLAIGSYAEPGWRAIHSLPLLVLVGVTGVGKSTLLAELAQHVPEHLLLPDRRQLTDELIISAMQAAGGLPIEPVNDRGLRFAFTRRYREEHEGGMAHALAQLWVHADAPNLLIFDGLRGENEVRYASVALPQARFVMLHAPDIVRLQRLLGRGDAFDRVDVATLTHENATNFAELGLPEASDIFNSADETTIVNWLQQGFVTVDELAAKLQIVMAERRSYDPLATLESLQRHAPHATLFVDTVTHAPEAVARMVIAWLALESK